MSTPTKPPTPPTNLQRVLESGGFAVAAEISPPRGVNLEAIKSNVRMLSGYVDALNVTDNQGASVRAASIPVCAIILREGAEPVAQMTCRDRNRIGMQSDLLGAALLGIRNLLCLTGDHMRWGDHPHAKPVFAIDSLHLLRMAREMRDQGRLDNGRRVKPAPDFFLGAAANPFAPPYDYRPLRLAKKIDAGAQFIQTQLIFNVDRFRAFMARVRELGLHKKAHILAGVGPLKSERQAQFMATEVPGMEVPPEIVRRMERTPKAAQAEEGIQICCEIVDQIREIPGLSGVHIMPVHWAEAVPEIVKRSGLDALRRERRRSASSEDADVSAA
jgi:5,10-methylenetetrahydrofolate reductase